MFKKADMTLWKGRDDGDGKQRWHQIISPLKEATNPPGIALLGISTDEGVKRNHGRIGAAAGPDMIRKYLTNQAYHLKRPIYDAGDLYCEQSNLESLQKEQANFVQKLLDQNHFPLLLGGGHEIAFGSFMGLEQHLKPSGTDAPIGIINFDAHFDLRSAAVPTSGTPFLQIAQYCQSRKSLFITFASV